MIAKFVHYGQLVVICLIAVITGSTARAALTVNPSSAGNVFYTTQTVSIPVAASVGTSINWKVTDYFSNQVATGSTPVSGGTATITPTTNSEIGFFTLAMTESTGTTTNSTGTTTFTIINAPPAQTNSPYGVQTHFADDTPQPTQTAIAPILAKGGFTQIRDELQWDAIEPTTPGTYTIPPSYSSYMSAAATSTLNPFITLDFGNPIYEDDGNPEQFTAPTLPATFTAFGNYSKQVISDFSSQIGSVEVWDEYNGGTFVTGSATLNLPLNYYDLLQSVHTGIKTAFPSVNEVAFASNPIADGFIKQVLSEGTGTTTGINYCDVISVHPYGYAPEGVDLQFSQLNSLIKSFNGGTAKPIWATEFSLGGTTTAEYFQETSYLARMITMMQSAGVAKMYYYTVQDDSSTPFRGLVGATTAQAKSGLLGNYLANPVYSAYSNLITQLYGWTSAGRVTSGLAQTSYVYKFTNGSNTKYVCWGGSQFSNAPTTLTMTTSGSAATSADIMGNATTLTISSGSFTVPVSGINPVYVTITGGSASAITEASNPIVADSVAGFSNVQGQAGWGYGTVTGTYTQSGFTALPWNIWSGDDYRWTPSGSPSQTYPFMVPQQTHPVSGKCTVRRWTSSVSGNATITGTITAPNNTDGVNCVIYVNGSSVLSLPASEVVNNAVVTFSVPNIPLSSGTVVDFVENINTSMSNDATGWATRITLSSSTVPTSVTAISGNASAMVAWQPVSGATAYEIDRSTTNGGPYTQVGTTNDDTSTTAFLNTGLTNGTTYYYVVTAKVGGTIGAQSSQVSVVPANSAPASPWVATDIGTVGVAGTDNQNSSANTFLQSGAGAGITGTADAFHFLSQPISANCTITAEVVGQYSRTNNSAEGGVMIRQSTATGAPFADCELTWGEGAEFKSRVTSGGSVATPTSLTGVAQPYWIRMVLSGTSSNTLTAYTSPDGETWTQLGSPQTISLTFPVQVGLTTTGISTSTAFNNAFSNVSITTP